MRVIGRAGGVVAAVLLTVTVAAPAATARDDGDGRVHLTFSDDDITESSGLVVLGTEVVTTNDSGDGPVLYVVNRRSGDTTATVTYSDGDVADVEALALGPTQAGQQTVWVGDIGDNDRRRPTIAVYRVPLDGREEVSAERYTLAYPDAPHDAEALLAHPRTGRLYVVTKTPIGGTVYAAPQRLRSGDAVNRLAEVGQVPGLVTGGSFFPDGRHLMLRSYGRAAVYAFPQLRQVAALRLPAQRQGEALAVGRDGGVYVSSEGVFSDVLQVLLPADLARTTGGSARPVTPPVPASPTTEAPPQQEDPATREDGELSTGDSDGAALAAAAVALGVTLVGWLAFTAGRRR